MVGKNLARWRGDDMREVLPRAKGRNDMSNGSFGFKPVLKQTDLDYVHGVIKRNEVLSVSGLDGTSDLQGYWTGVLEYGGLLGIMFWRIDTATTVFVFQRLAVGKDGYA